jgi:membrane-bound serine protease (ClpP class)
VALALCAAGLALLALAPAARTAREAAPADSAARPRVLAVRLEGPVSPVMDEALAKVLARAADEDYDAVLMEMDTPGGLETSMRSMIKRLLASERPVIAWVHPSGAHAASAGVFIVMACDVAAMSPGTNIGAATPINMQGPMDSTLARKATNDASAFARTVAAQRGRNVAWAERAVREAVSASEEEAVDLGIVDLVARSEAGLLEAADGRSWRRGERVDTLHTRGALVERVEPGFRQKVLGLLADPTIAYLLLMLGFYGLLFELQNPGAILPGVVGGICIVLAFLALSTLPVNAAGVALIVLGVAFLLAEIKVTSHGLLAAGGAVSLFLGSLILYRGDMVRLSLAVILPVTAATVLFFVFVIGAGLRAQRRKVVTGAAGLVGMRGVAVGRLGPAGTVRIGDELWNATSSATVEVGGEVEVTNVEGLTLRVRPLSKEA